MKFRCLKDNLLNGINDVSKAVTGRTTLQILECILITASENGTIRLTANDLELAIETSDIEAEVTEAGQTALDARLFSEIVKKVEGESITIASDEKNATKIECGGSKFNIMGMAGDEFPPIPSIEREVEYRILQSELKSMIRQTIFSISQDESRPVLTGELFEAVDGRLNIVAVDGYRISHRKSGLATFGGDKTAIIPGRTLIEISKILNQEEDSEAVIYFNPKHVLFDIGSCTVVSRLIEGDYIKYGNSFTEEHKTKAVVNRGAFVSALERSVLISRESKKTPVRINFQTGLITINSNTDTGAAQEELAAECEGEELTIAFNPKYILDAIKAVDDEKIVLTFTTALSPCIIRPLEGDSYRYLVLPLRM